MNTTKRIASLGGLGTSGRAYEVPDWVVGDGFVSEQIEARTPNLFLNDLDRSFTELAYTEAALRAQDDGFDAIVINTFGDYGLGSMRAVLSIPVVGAAQSALQLAVTLGERFGIVTVWPKSTRSLYARLLAANGVSDRCSGVYHVTADDELPEMLAETGVVASMRSGGAIGTEGEGILARIEAACYKAIDDGAEVIVLGCICMSPIHGELSQRLEYPVVDPRSAAHLSAETLLTLKLTRAAPVSPAMSPGMIRELFAGTPGALSSIEEDDGCGDVCSVLGELETEAVSAA